MPTICLFCRRILSWTNGWLLNNASYSGRIPVMPWQQNHSKFASLLLYVTIRWTKNKQILLARHKALLFKFALHILYVLLEVYISNQPLPSPVPGIRNWWGKDNFSFLVGGYARNGFAYSDWLLGTRNMILIFLIQHQLLILEAFIILCSIFSNANP